MRIVLTLLHPVRPVLPVLRVLLLCSALAAPAEALELNTASQAELERLRGIGVERSERLLQARGERPFADWDDLRRRVPRLGEKVCRELSDQGLRVNGQAWDRPR